MEPALRSGDWLLVDPQSPPPSPGDLVVAPDPRDPERWVVKRVGLATREGQLFVAGDSPEASTDSSTFGPVAAADVIGQPWFRYWPLRRLGRV